MIGRHVMLVGVLATALLSTGMSLGDDSKAAKPDTTKAKAKLPSHFKQLNLTEEQQDKLATIIAEYKAKIDTAEKELKSLKEKQKEEFGKVLTDAQKAQLQKILSESAIGVLRQKGAAAAPPPVSNQAEQKKESKKEDKK
ncbi:MAG TPA: hypothetical protein VK395_32920 [Gemmataceae bacterium]|nr:hypothetical protein [Gemmataceae bacterium]